MSVKLNANTKITQVVAVDSQNAEEIEKDTEHNDRKGPFAFSFPYYVRNTWRANKIIKYFRRNWQELSSIERQKQGK